MKILIEAPFDLNNESKAHIEKQISKLGQYESKITQANVYFKMDDGTESDVVLAEVQLHVPGPEIFASATDHQYGKALSEAIDKAKRQLIKRKEIRQDHHNS